MAARPSHQTSDLAERPMDELSGGQRKRVWIAMAAALRDLGERLSDIRPAVVCVLTTIIL
ncbi:ABC-type lipopolysaccharide export system ATPase subunit [Rhizobium mongolense]|uniref:ABC-type lipopolysaccharide export system ATPase subunit n=1 Tax=Rhizobium mongolense TaxID=57676 RepID=A0ABR6IIM9_9HYPH|nr:ABC-type lipopolysaccharide export system ATPase subunit [Rhizobium mongolense]